eukprot:scaffold68547_cov59-Attheya_sp.AAC.4
MNAIMIDTKEAEVQDLKECLRLSVANMISFNNAEKKLHINFLTKYLEKKMNNCDSSTTDEWESINAKEEQYLNNQECHGCDDFGEGTLAVIFKSSY